MTTIMNKATVLVTGASTGIGASYAERFARRGHDLVLVARNGERLRALASTLRAETGVQVDVLEADLTRTADVELVEARLGDDARTLDVPKRRQLDLLGEPCSDDSYVDHGD